MAFQDFLTEFAIAQGVGSKDALLTQHAERYSFQIQSRERARKFIEALQQRAGLNFKGMRILDVGCAYGSFTIELAKLGATVVGIDISDKWLKLAEANARDEVDARFFNCDASSYRAVSQLKAHGPFDLFLVNDVFEHIYDTVGLFNNINKMSAPGAHIYFKVPNGQATRHVLQEGHKKVFGISLLAPDYWSEFVGAPFHIYYRRWGYFEALFKAAGFARIEFFNKNTDVDHDTTKRFIVNDVNKIRRHLKAENFENPRQLAFLRTACRYFHEEVADDLENMAWDDLFFKYRVTFWEGMLSRSN